MFAIKYCCELLDVMKPDELQINDESATTYVIAHSSYYCEIPAEEFSKSN